MVLCLPIIHEDLGSVPITNENFGFVFIFFNYHYYSVSGVGIIRSHVVFGGEIAVVPTLGSVVSMAYLIAGICWYISICCQFYKVCSA